jgi:hypothetical protein
MVKENVFVVHRLCCRLCVVRDIGTVAITPENVFCGSNPLGVRADAVPGGGQVAYQSQFNDATSRAHAGKAPIKSKLIADLDPDEWGLPPKSKWMQ